MKIAIAYATKTGTAQQAAQQLAQALEARGFETALFNLANHKPDLNADAFVLGGSIRIGRWHRAARAFATQNEALLLTKPLALFACRCGTDDLPTFFAAQVGQALVSHAVYADCLGGAMDIEKQKGFDKFIVNMINKSSTSQTMAMPGIIPENVAACADALAKALAQ